MKSRNLLRKTRRVRSNNKLKTNLKLIKISKLLLKRCLCLSKQKIWNQY